jgi:hypothetical protein
LVFVDRLETASSRFRFIWPSSADVTVAMPTYLPLLLSR